MLDNHSSLQSIEAMCDSFDDQSATTDRTSPSITEEASYLQVSKKPSPSPGRQQESTASGVRPARTVFSAWQLAELEREYGSSRYLSSAQRRQLSSRLRLSEPTVKVWFQNRRMKEKRQHSESQVHYLNQLMQSYMLQLQCASGLAPVPPAAPIHPLIPPAIASFSPGYNQLLPTVEQGSTDFMASGNIFPAAVSPSSSSAFSEEESEISSTFSCSPPSSTVLKAPCSRSTKPVLFRPYAL